jgi:glycosyltransferase involved in cell wall biosynthesis
MSALSKDVSPEAGRRRRIAVLLPCYNEEPTIGDVVRDFRAALPEAAIYVFDNNSSDDTAAVATGAGATVVHSPLQGKGNVVRHMFRHVDADIYVMADGDSTYPADMAGELIDKLESTGADMVVGTRLEQHGGHSFRSLHKVGNRLISKLVSTLFSAPVTDILSGYRVFTRRLVRTLYLRATGFEIETELTLQTLVRKGVIEEVPIRYGARPEGSFSKLNTFADGALVFRGIFLIFKDYKPLAFFTAASGVCFVLGLVAGWRPVLDYAQTRYVSHVPLALLAAALEILAAVLLGIGLVLNAMIKLHMENHELLTRIFDRLEDSDNNL